MIRTPSPNPNQAHERTIHTDVLFGLLKGLLKRRKDLKVTLTPTPTLTITLALATTLATTLAITLATTLAITRTLTITLTGHLHLRDSRRREVLDLLYGVPHLHHPRPDLPRRDPLHQG